jgi:cysteine sulfinate desulfinase/cysteine desulfurase-like protein
MESRKTDFIYLDHNATTPIDPAAAKAMLPFIQEEFGNPSSPYSLGIKAKEKFCFWVVKATKLFSLQAGVNPIMLS